MRYHVLPKALGLTALILAFALPATAQDGRGVLTAPGTEGLSVERREIFPVGGQIVITRPGSYRLLGGFRATEAAPAIRIAAEGVTLDLGGFTVTGPGGKKGTGLLVEGASSVRVANGAFAAFGLGVQVVGSTNVSLSSLRVDGQDLGGSPPDVEIGVMILDSRGVVLESSTITRTFLGVFVRGAGSGGNRIEGNTLAAGANGGLGICYNPAPGLDDGPQGDLVARNLVSRYGKGIQTSPASVGNVFRDNVVAHTGPAAIEEMTGGSNAFAGNIVQQIAP
jgi:hypothetical protein